MPQKIATADGNLTTAATWGTVDATSFLDSEVGNTALTTAYVETQTFTPGAITIDGIAVKIASRNAAPSGTMSVRLAQAGATVAGTEVTINVSDIESRAGEQGWYFFKFPAPVLLVAATLYTVSAKTSVVSMVNLYRNGTAGNWSRMIRTTTTGAPAAGDDLYILGEWTAAATKTDRVVTMDSTAATDYGGASTTLVGFGIGKGGTLTFGATAATTYILRLSAILGVWQGGILNVGTTGTPMPRDSSARIEFDCAADGDFGLRVWGTFNGQGLSRTSGKNIVRCLLNTDEAAAQTVLGVDTDTGWLNGDEIAIASTTQTPGQAETRVLNGNAAASSITVTVGLTNAHSGTSPTQAEVILLTRNVRVESVSTTFMAYVHFGAAALVDLDWVAFRYLGASTTPKRGIEVDVSATAGGSLAMSFCSLRDFDAHGLWFVAADHGNWSVDNLVGWKIGHQASSQNAITIGATTGTNWSMTDVDIISGNAAQGSSLEANALGGTLTNIRLNSGAGHGLNLTVSGVPLEAIQKTWSGFNIHSHSQAGIHVNGLNYGKLSNVVCWRNNGGTAFAGIYAVTFCGGLLIENGEIFGNNTCNVRLGAGAGFLVLLFRTCTFNGDTTFAVTDGVTFGTNSPARMRFENCDFSTVAGIKTAHTNDIDIEAAIARVVEITFVNTKLGAATEIANQAAMRGPSFIRYQRVDQATGVHKTQYTHGLVSLEGTVFHTAAPSEKLEPNSASGLGWKLTSGVKRKRVLSAATVNVSVWVRKSAAYNGNAPRLVQKANPALGLDTDVVLDTHTAAVDTWEQLSGSTAAAEENGAVEFVVDCDGSAGAVYVDDWA